MLKAGTVFALALTCTIATSQINCGTWDGPYFDTKFETDIFTTDRKVTIITFTTSDRADFYELLLRAGAIADWEYEVDWDPQFRLKVVVTPDEVRPWVLDQESQLRRLLIQLSMTYRITGGRYKMVFRGAKSQVTPPELNFVDGELSYQASDVPSMLVVAALAESQRLAYRVDGLTSETISVTFVGAGLNDAFHALEANLDWNIKRCPRGLIVRRLEK